MIYKFDISIFFNTVLMIFNHRCNVFVPYNKNNVSISGTVLITVG